MELQRQQNPIVQYTLVAPPFLKASHLHPCDIPIVIASCVLPSVGAIMALCGGLSRLLCVPNDPEVFSCFDRDTLNVFNSPSHIHWRILGAGVGKRRAARKRHENGTKTARKRTGILTTKAPMISHLTAVGLPLTHRYI